MGLFAVVTKNEDIQNRLDLAKIEEFTLYIIEQNKINEKQNQEIEELKALVKELVRKNK